MLNTGDKSSNKHIISLQIEDPHHQKKGSIVSAETSVWENTYDNSIQYRF